MSDLQQRIVLSKQDKPHDLAHGSLVFIGTATVLFNYAGFTFLTDPNFLHLGDYAHLGYGWRTKRLTNPAIDFADLPPLDFVLLSHLHEDHFDRVVAHKLHKTLPIITTPQATQKLLTMGFREAHPLKTWQTLRVECGAYKLNITALPGRHAPGRLAALLPQVMGSMLEFQSSAGKTLMRLYISGDTLYYPQLQKITQRYPEVDLALLHLGGTRVFGLMVTMDAQQGLKLLKLIKPRHAIPIHYDDYTAFQSPLADFQRAVTNQGLQDRVHYLYRGDTYAFEVPLARLQPV